MNEADKILEMIESVDPADDDTLDEIDARVYHMIFGVKYYPEYTVLKSCKKPKGIVYKMPCGETQRLYPSYSEYTRSRDALKSIRPDGFEFPIDVLTNRAGFIFGYGCPAFNNGKFLAGYSKPLSTEELAELHAIIQSIKYEREQDGKS